MDVKQAVRGVLLPLGLLFPLFFLLSGRIYSAPDSPVWDSGGAIGAVPLPISLPLCFASIVLIGAWPAARRELVFALAFCAAMAAATALALGFERPKLILLVQFAIPAGALVLGAMTDRRDDRALAATWLVFVPLFMAAQLYFAWADQHMLAVHHHMRFFSVYQHRQFVPVVLASAYLVAAFGVWRLPSGRPAVILSAPLVMFYAMLSVSLLAIGILAMGFLLLAAVERRTRAWLVLVGCAIAVALAVLAIRSGATGAAVETVEEKLPVLVERDAAVAATQAPAKLPPNFERRLQDWALYGKGIVESPLAAIVGHARPIDRAVSTSAHNYYLDLTYNFGLLGLLPFAWLIVLTLRSLWRARDRVRGDLPLIGLAFVAVFLTLIDNSFKVSFRQPYPGIFGFFLWGWLLSRLRG